MKRATPLWRGPELDGITFSMLSKFLVCRERFRIQVMDGIRANYGFEHRAEYGNLFHVCVESFAAFKNVSIALNSLKKYVSQLLVQHPMHKQDVSKWYQVCAKQFPIYVEYWKNTEEKYRTPLVQERVFDVEYVLPSGDKVRLRGKFDGVDLMEIPNDISIKLGESKTKGDVDQSKIQKQLLFDLQTMMYLTVLTQDTGIREIEAIKEAGVPVTGVRYNVVRRPLSGGKGTIVRHKGTKTKAEETEESYYNRLAEYISAEPESYFMRWTSEVQQIGRAHV